MVSNKFKRSQERKERREAEKFKNEQKKERQNKPKYKQKWRRLSDGGIAFGNQYKIGQGGLIAFGCIGVIAVFFAVGLTLYPLEQQEGGICANPFCEWIDILTGADEYGAKQTPREQVPMEDRDFLPPTQSGGAGVGSGGFLLPLILPEAEARGEDEPICYSQACQRALDEGRLGVDSKEYFADEKEQEKDLNEKIKEMKMKIDKTKDVIKVIEEKIRKYIAEIPKKELDLIIQESDIEDQIDIVKELKYEYDRVRYNYHDKEELAEAEKLWRDQQKKLKDLQFKYDKLESDIERDNDLLDKEEENLKLAEIDLLMFMDDLNKLKIELNKVHRAGNLFAIRLSETCNTLIKNGMNEYEVAKIDENNWVYEKETKQKCPTYRELKKQFDNTLEGISGEFIDYGYDIRRGESGYDQYWRYYYNLPEWKVITVDPDVDMLYRAMIIEIQASGFRFGVDNESKHQLNIARFDNGTINPRGYVYYENVSIDEKCRHANVAPDMELVAKVLEHFMNECEDQLEYQKEKRVILPYISFDKMESQYYQYVTWLNNAIKESNEYLIGK